VPSKTPFLLTWDMVHRRPYFIGVFESDLETVEYPTCKDVEYISSAFVGNQEPG